ncbi:RdgB/HAM1 family non-canonical purine NTP pyrophosphatase [Hymenobacter sp. BRD128]|uniref:RdgB/HAM1 family non-canonical purine NTP pyrophosphatase n=1 Tax=Hymenobacter sp. BRD128 TaxID=2675878 RepID=UPI0015663C4F|nr:RdgB/HAM1 family non-canonical purine NTP pyrophosphatase [Hymenobacter sp. BRD128]QKG57639.1 RdgB/HAM1 family non-canonical purine NTP pyrophosphatase [Hymenobacter sp. BRD128]
MRLCFASNNAHKLDEIRPLLPAAVQLLSLADIGCREELPETQPTLEGNARQKAQYVWDHYGVACFADDTGLEVDALGGAPGVYSARYAGPQREAADNVAKLLRELATQPHRQARFRTVISLVRSSSDAHEFSGEVAGVIAAAPIGRGGFGYDPVFVPSEGDGRTFAEMTLAEKNMLSHRARAVAELLGFLNVELGIRQEESPSE